MDRFRVDDPDAAEKALRLFNESKRFSPLDDDRDRERKFRSAMQAVLDAIEQPRLPTRSLVSQVCMLDKWQADRMVEEGWATEDPEPEVDERHVLAVALLHAVRATTPIPGARFSAVQATAIAGWLLASGRVQVTP